VATARERVTIGLLWFDASKRKPLEEKVSEAVAAYKSKPSSEDRIPDTCYVHPSTMSRTTVDRVNEVRLIGMRAVSPHCFYVVHVGDDGDGLPERHRRPSWGSRSSGERVEGRGL
jgi:hypothetical protein